MLFATKTIKVPYATQLQTKENILTTDLLNLNEKAAADKAIADLSEAVAEQAAADPVDSFVATQE